MKQKLMSLFVAVMLLVAALGVASADQSIAGDYILDATPLGMPLRVYLTIGEDNTFRLSNQLSGGEDKGSGRVGSSGDTYMLLFDDSTPENPKTATFTVVGKQLIFNTRLPYGSSGFAPNLDDAEHPIYPTAKAIVYAEQLGEYVGSHEETIAAMNSTLTYAYTLTLAYGAEYTFESRYAVMGQEQVFTQSGTFAIEGQKLLLTAAGEDAAEAGEIAADGAIAIKMLVSAQGKEKKDITLKPATTGAYAGVYAGQKTMNMGMPLTADATLALDKVGGYALSVKIAGEEAYAEKGAFAVDGAAVTFTNEGAEPVSGTLENDVLTVKFRISQDVPMATEIMFYSGRIQGVFTDAAEDEGLASTLTLNPDATYTISVTQDGQETYAEAGTFETAASPMGVRLILKSEAGELSGVVSDASININHPIAAGDATAVGFQYAK